ncbi:CoA transferase subunit A [Georgenia sp. Z1344]|uniref:CoA transferase subunit A n=1 Tax=Georgenia sp. Z1344 TaxID=3416706 RepID=UPI003CE94A86
MTVSERPATGRGLDKVVGSAAEAVADIGSGSLLAVGGFGLSGNPSSLIDALLAQGADDLTVVSNNCGIEGVGLGVLLGAGRLRKMVASYVGENKDFESQYLGGTLEVELNPQGTLAERLRAGGSGVAAFYTPTGVGTQFALGGLPQVYNADGSVAKASAPKETRTFVVDGEPRSYVLEEAIRADFALVHALVADRHGNLVFNKSSRNFNPLAAMSGKVTIVEAEEIVEPGELDPDDIHLPGVFVHRLVHAPATEGSKPIEKRTVRTENEEA